MLNEKQPGNIKLQRDRKIIFKICIVDINDKKEGLPDGMNRRSIKIMRVARFTYSYICLCSQHRRNG